MQNLRVYVQGSNLAVWDHVKMWDPEIGNSGARYPINATWTFGLDVTIWMFLKNLLRIWTKKKFFPKLNISNNGMRNFIKPVRIIRKQVWMCKVQMELLMRKLSILEKLFVLILMY